MAGSCAFGPIRTPHAPRGQPPRCRFAAFPYAWLAYGCSNDPLAERVLRFLRVMRAIVPLLRAAMSTAKVNSNIRINPGWVRLLQLLLIFVLCSHAIGCLWWLVATYQPAVQGATDLDASSTWIPSPWLQEQAFDVQCAHAFLWGASLMTGFVLYDVSPQALPEVVTSLTALVFGFFFSIILISSTTSALSAMDARNVVNRMKVVELIRLARRCTEQAVTF